MNLNTSEILFEKFRVIETLKKDDYSAVYLADHIYLGKKIILKCLNTELITDHSITERFKREAKILAQLDHPNIIRVLDFGTSGEFFYISFEYFDGNNLRYYISKNSLGSEKKKELLIQLLKGLSYAHDNGIVHRDLKPENILINEKLRLKIGDFGLAQSEADSFLTNKYSILGTPSYMSPEQVLGDKLTDKSDLFSAGVIILELYLGQNPFLGKDVNESINKIIDYDESALFSEIDEVPPEIKDLAEKVILRKPENRISSKEALILLSPAAEKDFQKNTVLPKEKKKKVLKKVLFLALGGTAILFAILMYWPEYYSETPPDSDTMEQKDTVMINKEETGHLQVSVDLPTENNSEEIKKPANVINESAKALSQKVEEPGEENSFTSKGELFVECYPWADLYINSEKIETTPIEKGIKLKEGEYDLTLRHPDFPEYNKKINILSDETLRIKVDLDTLYAYLVCKVFPWGEVYVGGTYKGQTPFIAPLKVIPGETDLLIKNPEFDPVNKRITLSRNDTLVFLFDFNDSNKLE